ncbi:MAG: lysophospholipase [Leptospiraceae bacterium]|nr:lysophospholipase [Leptospiraceae bacterium]MCB1199141.1 lysophospholipase [Leptospiraceae bacterium]
MNAYNEESGFIREKVPNGKIFYRAWFPANETVSRVFVFQHGFGEHSGRYSNLINEFAGTGTVFFGMDAFGHGRSAGKRGSIEKFSKFSDDLAEFISSVVSKSGQNKFYLLGHSMGGLIATEYALQHQKQLHGLILSGAAFSPVLNLENQIKKILATGLSKIIPEFTMDAGIPATALSHDPKTIQEYQSDPLVHGNISTQLGAGLFETGDRLLKNAGSLHIPLLVFHGGSDTVADPAAAEEFYRLAGSSDKTLKIWPFLFHETMNEAPKDNKAVLDFVKQWVLSHT